MKRTENPRRRGKDEIFLSILKILSGSKGRVSKTKVRKSANLDKTFEKKLSYLVEQGFAEKRIGKNGNGDVSYFAITAEGKQMLSALEEANNILS